jgi:hypothetical protein
MVGRFSRLKTRIIFSCCIRSKYQVSVPSAPSLKVRIYYILLGLDKHKLIHYLPKWSKQVTDMGNIIQFLYPGDRTGNCTPN